MAGFEEEMGNEEADLDDLGEDDDSMEVQAQKATKKAPTKGKGGADAADNKKSKKNKK